MMVTKVMDSGMGMPVLIHHFDPASLSPQERMKLAKDDDVSVRRGIAHLPDLSVELAELLAEDDDARVVGHLTLNHSCPVQVVEKLAVNGEWIIRSKIAANPRTPLDIVFNLLDDEEDFVVSSAASNPSLPAEKIVELFERFGSTSSAIVSGLSLNSNIPADVAVSLAKKSGSKTTLLNLALNTGCPQEVIGIVLKRKILASHDEDFIFLKLFEATPEYKTYPREWLEALLVGDAA